MLLGSSSSSAADFCGTTLSGPGTGVLSEPLDFLSSACLPFVPSKAWTARCSVAAAQSTLVWVALAISASQARPPLALAFLFLASSWPLGAKWSFAWVLLLFASSSLQSTFPSFLSTWVIPSPFLFYLFTPRFFFPCRILSFLGSSSSCARAYFIRGGLRCSWLLMTGSPCLPGFACRTQNYYSLSLL